MDNIKIYVLNATIKIINLKTIFVAVVLKNWTLLLKAAKIMNQPIYYLIAKRWMILLSAKTAMKIILK